MQASVCLRRNTALTASFTEFTMANAEAHEEDFVQVVDSYFQSHEEEFTEVCLHVQSDEDEAGASEEAVQSLFEEVVAQSLEEVVDSSEEVVDSYEEAVVQSVEDVVTAINYYDCANFRRDRSSL